MGILLVAKVDQEGWKMVEGGRGEEISSCGPQGVFDCSFAPRNCITYAWIGSRDHCLELNEMNVKCSLEGEVSWR